MPETEDTQLDLSNLMVAVAVDAEATKRRLAELEKAKAGHDAAYASYAERLKTAQEAQADATRRENRIRRQLAELGPREETVKNAEAELKAREVAVKLREDNVQRSYSDMRAKHDVNEADMKTREDAVKAREEAVEAGEESLKGRRASLEGWVKGVRSAIRALPDI